MDKNLILKKIKKKTMNLENNKVERCIKNNKIYIYSNDESQFYDKLNDSINKFSNFICSFFTDKINLNNDDFVIYPENIIDNPLGIKNVIRIIQSNSFSLYPPTDIILYYSET